MRRFALGVAFSFALACGAWPEEPPPILSKTVKTAESDSSTGASPKQNIKETERNSTDWWMFGATIGIGFIGFLQLLAFIKQANYLRTAAREMHATTEAAKKVAEDQITHSHHVERAYISGGGCPERRRQLRQADSGTGGQIIEVLILTGNFEVHVNNQGKTAGEIREIALEFCNADSVPLEPIYNKHDYVRRPHRDWYGPSTQSRRMFAVPIPKDIPNPVIYGRFYYRDIFSDKIHSCGFIQSIDMKTGDSQPILPPSRGYIDWD